uniref:Uncharacterized protein n=1 Tax=viral metagenome TaxID=1070528 RepID=A0A6M3J5Y9_9ZZZZ
MASLFGEGDPSKPVPQAYKQAPTPAPGTVLAEEEARKRLEWQQYSEAAKQAGLEGVEFAEGGRTAAWGQGQLGLGAAQQQQHAAAVRGGALGARMGMYAGAAQAGDVTQQAAVGRAQEVSRARQAYLETQQQAAEDWITQARTKALAEAQALGHSEWFANWQAQQQAQRAAETKAAWGEAIGAMGGAAQKGAEYWEAQDEADAQAAAASDRRLKRSTRAASGAEQDAVIAALQRRIAALEGGQ